MHDERSPSWDLRGALIRSDPGGPQSASFPCRFAGCDDRGSYGKPFCESHILAWPYARMVRALVDARAAELRRRRLVKGSKVPADVAAVLRYDLAGSSTVPNLVRRTSLPAWAVVEALKLLGATPVVGRRRKSGRGRVVTFVLPP